MTTESQRKAQKKYAESQKGKTALKKAAERFESENADRRREYKRLKAQEYRLREKGLLNKDVQNSADSSLHTTQTLILAFTLLAEFSSKAQPLDFGQPDNNE